MKSSLIKKDADHWFWGLGEHTLNVREQIHMAAHNPVHALIVGETGTGKEFVSRVIHETRRKALGLTIPECPFIPVNSASIPEALAESILFGHERGAFTSARERQMGKFEIAGKGTLFLDEVQSLDLSLQCKLLRVLQSGEIDRLGSRKNEAIHCQIIAATNIPLEILVREQRFRRDLYYRLNVCPIYLPALRHRICDIPIIAKGLQQRIFEKHRLLPKQISNEVLQIFSEYTWPGNMRELEHAILYASMRADKIITSAMLPPHISGKIESYLEAGLWA